MNLDDIPAHLRDRVEAARKAQARAADLPEQIVVDVGLGDPITLTKIDPDTFAAEIPHDHPAFADLTKNILDAVNKPQEPETLSHIPDDLPIDHTMINMLVDILNAHRKAIYGLTMSTSTVLAGFKELLHELIAAAEEDEDAG